MPLDMALSERLPTPDETRKAQEATRILGRVTGKDGGLAVRLRLNEHDETLVLPPAVSRMVLDLLMHIGKGEAVTFVPFGAELSTQQAADMLNVSRPFLIKLLDSGQIPHHKVGKHRRVSAEEVFKYKHKRDTNRVAALDELAKVGQEIDSE
jgi:excisionase family DNA binding protein